MLIKTLTPTAANDQEFAKLLKKRTGYFFILIALGIITILCSLYFSSGNHAYLSEYTQGLYCGIGTGLILGGILLIIKIRITLKDSKKVHTARLKEQDERNLAIAQKAMHSALLILLVLIYLVMLISSFFNLIIFKTLLCTAMAFTLLLAITKFYYQRKY